jgi:hypothetical protein
MICDLIHEPDLVIRVSKENVFLSVIVPKFSRHKRIPICQIKNICEEVYSEDNLYKLKDIPLKFLYWNYGRIIDRRIAVLELHDGRRFFVGFDGVEKFTEVLSNLLARNQEESTDNKA